MTSNNFRQYKAQLGQSKANSATLRCLIETILYFSILAYFSTLSLTNYVNTTSTFACWL